MRILLFLSYLAACSDNTKHDAPPDMADPCLAQCTMDEPVGGPMAVAFFECMNTACQQYSPESPELLKCMSDAIDPANPNAVCRSQTDRCFEGKIGGCKELADQVEKACATAPVPISDMDYFAAAGCIMSEGWKGATSAQAKAWPLFNCVFAMDGSGCFAECQQTGAAGCRACAQQRCGTLYDACMADTSTAVSTDVPADKASCQKVTNCLLSCG